MIFNAIFAMLATLVGGLFGLIIPTLPANFLTVFNIGFRYLQSGLGFIWLVIDRDFVASLAMWWIGFTALAFTVELAMEVWRAITGNFGGQDISAEVVTETEYERSSNPYTGNPVVIRTSTQRSSSKTRRRLPKLPH